MLKIHCPSNPKQCKRIARRRSSGKDDIPEASRYVSNAGYHLSQDTGGSPRNWRKGCGVDRPNVGPRAGAAALNDDCPSSVAIIVLNPRRQNVMWLCINSTLTQLSLNSHSTPPPPRYTLLNSPSVTHAQSHAYTTHIKYIFVYAFRREGCQKRVCFVYAFKNDYNYGQPPNRALVLALRA